MTIGSWIPGYPVLTDEKGRDFRIRSAQRPQDLWIAWRPEPQDQPAGKVPWMLPAEVPKKNRKCLEDSDFRDRVSKIQLECKAKCPPEASIITWQKRDEGKPCFFFWGGGCI